MEGREHKTGLISRLPRHCRAALFVLLQWTWGLPQNLVGLLVLLLLGRQERFRFHGAVVTLFKKNRLFSQNGAFSLGTFIFIPQSWGEDFCRRIAIHEYGHTVQSMILGPLYLPAVGLPSVIWSGVWSRSKALVRQSEAAKQSARGGKTASIGAARLKRAQRTASTRYTARYPENWANVLGEYATGERPPEH